MPGAGGTQRLVRAVGKQVASMLLMTAETLCGERAFQLGLFAELGADLPLDAALALANREFLLLFATEDKTEGMRAFLEKRTPRFKGR